MAKVRPRKVKILEESSKFITLLFIDHQCRMQLPKNMFKRRLELGIYLVINPGVAQPVL